LILELERYLDFGSVRFDLAIGDLHIELDNLGDTKVSQTLRSTFDCGARGSFSHDSVLVPTNSITL
jgi:hypothetical protein